MMAPIVALKHGVNDPESFKKNRVAHADRHFDSLANDSDIISINEGR